MAESEDAAGFDPSTYGRSFADVYDDWYPADDSTDAAVRRIAELAGVGAGSGGSVLELGVGTGRLALPLAARGLVVTGMDASSEMLAQLMAKCVDGTGAHAVETVQGDIGDPDAWPVGPFDVVVAAFNLVFNLADPGTQAACFTAAASVLGPGGTFVVETFLPARLDERERVLEVREVTATRVTLIATDSDHDSGVVTGQHIELRDGEPVRLRPWRIRVATPDELDRLAADAGLELVERHADWAGTPFDAHGAAQVSVYRLR